MGEEKSFLHDEHEMAGLLFAQELEEHAAHDEQRTRGETVGAGHTGIGEIAAEQKGVAVHHVDGLLREAKALF